VIREIEARSAFGMNSAKLHNRFRVRRIQASGLNRLIVGIGGVMTTNGVVDLCLLFLNVVFSLRQKTLSIWIVDTEHKATANSENQHEDPNDPCPEGTKKGPMIRRTFVVYTDGPTFLFTV